jgi:hypothetical protein
MSDAFGAVFGGSRGVHHLSCGEREEPRGFRERVRALSAGLAAGEAEQAASLDQLVARYGLSVAAYAIHNSSGAADGELAMELVPAEEPEASSRALVLFSEDLRSQLAGGRVFFLDREFEVRR